MKVKTTLAEQLLKAIAENVMICPTCDGAGEVDYSSDNAGLHKCPECNGTGRIIREAKVAEAYYADTKDIRTKCRNCSHIFGLHRPSEDNVKSGPFNRAPNPGRPCTAVEWKGQSCECPGFKE